MVEENSYRYSETNNDRLSIVPVLNDNVIQSLLEQAKIEGIYSEPDRISSNKSIILVILVVLIR